MIAITKNRIKYLKLSSTCFAADLVSFSSYAFLPLCVSPTDDEDGEFPTAEF